MAFFIRTRRLDLTRLERKPQENIDVVHVILKAAVRDIGDKLRRVERQFYGPRTSPEDEVKKWNKALDRVLKAVRMGQITNSWQLEEIIRQSGEQADHFSIDPSDLSKLRECYRKISDAVPTKFSETIADCGTVMKYLQKYCLSFYDPDTDVPYETAQHYESRRREHLRTIRTNLDAVIANGEKFRNKKKGFTCSALSDFGFQLARKTDTTHLCFLVLFPQSAENIRVSLRAMTSLIDADSDYPTFVRNDVIDLEQKKDETLKSVRNLQQKFHQMSFRLKQLEHEVSKMEAEIAKLNDKELDLMIQEEELVAETNEIQVEIEMTEYRRDELLKKAGQLKYSQLSENLRDLRRRLPFAKRELFAARHKLEWVAGKKTELRQTKTKLKKLKQEMDKVYQEKQEHEVDYDNTLRCLDLAKRILLRKTSADSMEKIFHDRPVEVNRSRLPGQKMSDDTFEKVCQVVSEHIDGDWPKLYRALPFYPPRGVSTIDGDIEELTSVQSRVGGQYLALKSLHRWRRFHTRAKVEDINTALAAIKRYDVINKIDLDLNPPEETKEEPEEKITYVEEYLIPFVKQVERFDELRAQNRL